MYKSYNRSSRKGRDMISGDIISSARRGLLGLMQMRVYENMGDPSIGNNKPIRLASAAGHTEIVWFLINLPSDPNTPFILSINPAANRNEAIRMASANGHLSVVQCLAALPEVDPAAVDNYAICMASANGHLPVVQFLAGCPGVNPTANSNEAINEAVENGHLSVVQFLLGLPGITLASIDYKSICRAVMHGHLPIVRFYANHPDSEFSKWGWKAFRSAVQNGRLAIVQFLSSFSELDDFTFMEAITDAMNGNHHEVEQFLRDEFSARDGHIESDKLHSISNELPEIPAFIIYTFLRNSVCVSEQNYYESVVRYALMHPSHED